MGSWRRVRRASYVQRRACLFVRNKQSATPIVSQFETLPQSLSAAFGQSLVFYSGKTTMLTPEFPSASLIEASVCSCECLLRARDTHIAVITPYSACPGTGGRHFHRGRRSSGSDRMCGGRKHDASHYTPARFEHGRETWSQSHTAMVVQVEIATSATDASGVT